MSINWLEGCELYSEIVESHPYPTAIILENGVILYTNKALSKALGYEHGELEGMHFANITHPDDISLDIDLFDKMNEGFIDGYEIRKRYLNKDGEPIDALLTVKKRYLKSQAIRVIYGFFIPNNFRVGDHVIKIIRSPIETLQKKN